MHLRGLVVKVVEWRRHRVVALVLKVQVQVWTEPV
jgi:hypothetical protein